MTTLVNETEALLRTVGLIENSRRLRNLEDLPEALRSDAGSRYIDFDTECIVEAEDYRALLERYKLAVEPDDKIEIVSVSYDCSIGRAEAEVSINGRIFRSTWDQTDDWVTTEFFDLISDFSQMLKGRFVTLPPMDQCYRCLYLLEPTAGKVEALFNRIGVI